MNKVAVVTGAGSGVGQATALLLQRNGWRVALVGRRESALQETAAQADPSGPTMLVAPCDISDEAAVQALAAHVQEQLGDVEVLVNGAGTNTPKRSLAVLSNEDYHRLIDTNLHGAYYCVQAFLPSMRARKSGTIVNISSNSALQASAKAGVAYVISKFGMRGLNQSINAEERANGIRACAIFPGDINTPILELRPEPPAEEIRQRMIQSEDIAECVLLVVTLPARAVVEEMLVQPGTM